MTDINHMFRLQFEKTAAEIKQKSELKTAALASKVIERGKRIDALRSEYDIDDAALIQILTEAAKRAEQGRFDGHFTYSNSNKVRPNKDSKATEGTIGAGVVSHLMEERKLIAEELQQVQRLELIIRNLRPLQRHVHGVGHVLQADEFEDRFVLTYEELEFLGF